MKRNFLLRHFAVVLALVVLTAVWILSQIKPSGAFQTIGSALREMLLVMPPAYVLAGPLDVYVSRERLIRCMGAGSGFAIRLSRTLWAQSPQGRTMQRFPWRWYSYERGAAYST